MTTIHQGEPKERRDEKKQRIMRREKKERRIEVSTQKVVDMLQFGVKTDLSRVTMESNLLSFLSFKHIHTTLIP